MRTFFFNVLELIILCSIIKKKEMNGATEMSDEERYKAALEYAAEKHKGQIRKGGAMYITHPMAVEKIIKERGFPIDYRITALFHDLLEDTDATEDEIEKIGGSEVLKSVKILTKERGYNMSEYIGNIKKNKMAYEVKKADRLHNLRSAIYADEEFQKKYIVETNEWYLDFSDEIKVAVRELEKRVIGKG